MAKQEEPKIEEQEENVVTEDNSALKEEFETTLQMIENNENLTPEEKKVAREQLAAEVGLYTDIEKETGSEGNDTEA